MVLGGFSGSGGSVWLMGEWTVGRWIGFQKIYGPKHDIVEVSRDVTDAGGTDKQQRKIVLLSF